jgi:carbonic anhydrase/acetyltransferase-like protein (isoleucine patch superfamily)
MAIYSIGERRPRLAPTAWVAPGAHVLGDVELAEGASVWFGAVLHTDMGFPMTIGARVTIGHQAMLHGCTVGDGSLIGIQAIVLNGARIGRECLIGAGALIAEGKVIPDRSVVLGSPGKVVRTLTDEDVARMRAGADSYIGRAAAFDAELKRLDP